MKLSNFEIEDRIALRYLGQYFDLHNDFDFYEFKYSVSSQVLELQWNTFEEINNGFSVNNFTKLKLLFSTVNYLKIQERDSGMPITEDKCVNVIGFSPQEMREDMNSFGVKPNFDNDDMIINFRGGQTFKINADMVELVIIN
jgi:hypothetical protein